MPEFRSRWIEKTDDPLIYSPDRTDKTPSVGFVEPIVEGSERFSGCHACGRPLVLPETRTLGACLRCLDEAGWIDYLALLRLRRERRHAAVAARVEQLRLEAAR